jgi:hypothetical protein
MRSIFLAFVLSLNNDAIASLIDLSFPNVTLERVAFGSCNKQLGFERQQNEAWRSIAKFNPQLWLWTGDAVYVKSHSVSGLTSAFNVQKAMVSYRDFILGDSNQRKPLVDGIWVCFLTLFFFFVYLFITNRYCGGLKVSVLAQERKEENNSAYGDFSRECQKLRKFFVILPVPEADNHT